MVLFTETQRFTQVWIWALLLGVAALFWYGAFKQLAHGRPWGSNPASDGVLVVAVLLAGILLPALFYVAHLRTEVRPEGIRLRFFPFHLQWRHWSFDEIRRLDSRRYSALREFGGVGIRIGPAGWAYIVRGTEGVQLELTSGERLLIGTQDPSGFLDAVTRAGQAGRVGPRHPLPSADGHPEPA